MTFLIGGLFLGFLSSGHCLAMCGPIAYFCASRQLGENSSPGERMKLFLMLGTGKALIYGWIGLCFGWAGHLLTRWSSWMGFAQALPWVSGALFILSGLSLMGVFPAWELAFQETGKMLRRNFPIFASARTASAQWITGMIWGFLPCPMVLAPALGSVVSGSMDGAQGALRGFLMMFGFGLGTIPALYAGALTAGVFQKIRAWSPKVVGVLMITLGLLMIGLSKPVMQKHCQHCYTEAS